VVSRRFLELEFRPSLLRFLLSHPARYFAALALTMRVAVRHLRWPDVSLKTLVIFPKSHVWWGIARQMKSMVRAPIVEIVRKRLRKKAGIA
jgi:hypothetical protein